MGLLSFAPQRDQGLDPITGRPRQLPVPPQSGGKLGLLGATLQDVAAGLNGQVGGSVQRQQAGMLAQQKTAAQQAQLRQIEASITDPNELALFRTNPEAWSKARASQYETVNVGGGDSRFIPGQGFKTAPKLVADNGVYGTQTADGYTGTGARAPSIAEAETARQNDPNTLGGLSWGRVQDNGLGRDRLALDTTKAAQDYRLGMGNLGVSQGNLGVAQGNLSLGRQKFDWEKAGGPAQNATAAAARASLPTVLDNANQFLADIDKTKKDPQLGWRTGASGMIPAIPGSKGAGFDARVGQLQGQAFLRAYDGLRGTGAISEIEGKKATESIARLNRAQSAEDFKAALDDLAGIVRTGAARAQRMAGQSGAPAPAAGGWSIVR